MAKGRQLQHSSGLQVANETATFSEKYHKGETNVLTFLPLRKQRHEQLASEGAEMYQFTGRERHCTQGKWAEGGDSRYRKEVSR